MHLKSSIVVWWYTLRKTLFRILMYRIEHRLKTLLRYVRWRDHPNKGNNEPSNMREEVETSYILTTQKHCTSKKQMKTYLNIVSFCCLWTSTANVITKMLVAVLLWTNIPQVDKPTMVAGRQYLCVLRTNAEDVRLPTFYRWLSVRCHAICSEALISCNRWVLFRTGLNSNAI